MKAADKYDSYAEIAGGAAGLDPKTWPGLAHILRQVAHDEREACAREVERIAWSAPTANGEWALREVAKVAAHQIRHRAINE